MLDVVAIAASFLTAAAKSYGRSLLDAIGDKASDASADATLSLGRRLLRRLFATKQADAINETVAELADNPNEPDTNAALRVLLRRAIVDDPALATELAEMLPTQAGVVINATGERSVGAQTINGIVATGDNSTITR
jgi:hypothetical protein